MKATHWYLRNWEYENNRLVYKGEYYRVGGNVSSLPSLKMAYGGLCMLQWILIIVLLFHISRGASLFFVGGSVALSMIPSIYLLAGVFQFLKIPDKMTYRDLHASIYRIRLSEKWSVCFFTVAFFGELFYIGFRLVSGLEIAWRSEALWLVGTQLAMDIPVIYLILLSKFREEVLPNER
jgi:hypothetical protein